MKSSDTQSRRGADLSDLQALRGTIGDFQKQALKLDQPFLAYLIGLAKEEVSSKIETVNS